MAYLQHGFRRLEIGLLSEFFHCCWPVRPTGKLQVLTGQFAGRELSLVKALTTLGRPGGQVVAVTRRSDGYYVVRVAGDSAEDAPMVNGSAVGSKAVRLADSDVLELAGVKMGFFDA